MNKQIVPLLNNFISWLEKKSNRNIPNNYTQNESFIFSYFSTQVEYAYSISALVETENFIAIPPVFRSLLEAHVDLVNLCLHREYKSVLFGIFLKQQIKDLENSFKEPNNPFIEDHSKTDYDIGTVIKTMRKSLNELKGKINKNFDKRIFQIKKRFELADLEDFYSGIYSPLSSDSHNDIYNVDTRYVDYSKVTENIYIKSQWDISNVRPHLTTLPGVLASSLLHIFDRFLIDGKEEINEKRDDIFFKLEVML